MQANLSLAMDDTDKVKILVEGLRSTVLRFDVAATDLKSDVRRSVQAECSKIIRCMDLAVKGSAFPPEFSTCRYHPSQVFGQVAAMMRPMMRFQIRSVIRQQCEAAHAIIETVAANFSIKSKISSALASLNPSLAAPSRKIVAMLRHLFGFFLPRTSQQMAPPANNRRHLRHLHHLLLIHHDA